MHAIGKRKASFSLFDNSIYRGSNYIPTEQLEAYSYSAYVYACVKKRAEKVGQLISFKMFDLRGNEILNDPILQLLEKPNNYQTKDEFFELYQTYKDLTGSAFIWVLKIGNKTKELNLLKPDLVTIKYSEQTGEIIGYEYGKANGTKVNIPADEVIASFNPSPITNYVGKAGLSPLRPGGKSVDTETQLMDYQRNVLKNGGKIEGILQFKTDYLSEEQIKELQEKFQQRFADAKRSGTPLVMYGDGDYKNLGLTPTELSFLESKKATREDVMMIYGVPKTVLGITDGVQKGNYEEANRNFINETIEPLIKNITNKLNQFLVPENRELVAVDVAPDDIDLKLKKIESGGQYNYMTINERRELMGLEPVPEGDIIPIPMNLMSLGEDIMTE